MCETAACAPCHRYTLPSPAGCAACKGWAAPSAYRPQCCTWTPWLHGCCMVAAPGVQPVDHLVHRQNLAVSLLHTAQLPQEVPAAWAGASKGGRRRESVCGGPPNAVPTAAACSVCRRLLRYRAHAAEGRSPELALGLDIVLRPDLHAVDGRGGLMLGGQVASDHLVLVPLESALRRAQNSASSMRVAPMQQGRLHLLRGRRAACVATSAAYLHHFRPSAGERGRGRGLGGE